MESTSQVNSRHELAPQEGAIWTSTGPAGLASAACVVHLEGTGQSLNCTTQTPRPEDHREASVVGDEFEG